MAGGAVSFLNPAPIAPFIDFFFLGEIEPQLDNFLELLLNLKRNHAAKHDILTALAEADGIFVPSKYSSTKTIKREYRSLKEHYPQYSSVISPDSHFKNMFLVEAGRGCGRRCNFCAASHIYHPFRIFPSEKILTTIQTFHQHTKRIGLIGAALSDYPGLFQLCEELVSQGFELGLSSFRLDMITPAFLKILEKGKIQSLTFAPEAGTEKLRNTIHKNLTEQQILDAASAIAGSNINHIKLYFLIGLPGEQDDDIEGIVDLVRSIQRILWKKGKTTISISVNTFIPKPFTPFQWATMATTREIHQKRNYLEKQLQKIIGSRFTRKSAKEEILQGIFSLGSQDLARGIYHKLKDRIEWQAAWDFAGVNVETALFGMKNFEDEFPWDFIDYGISKERLWKIWQSTKK